MPCSHDAISDSILMNTFIYYTCNFRRVTIHVESGVFPKLHKLRVEIWGEDDGKDLVKNSEHESPVSKTMLNHGYQNRWL